MRSLLLAILLCVTATLAWARLEVVRGENPGDVVVLEYGIHPYTNSEQVISTRQTTMVELDRQVQVLTNELNEARQVKSLAERIR